MLRPPRPVQELPAQEGERELALQGLALAVLPTAVTSTLALQLAAPLAVMHARLQRNALTALPPGFYAFYTALRTLDLSSNALELLPPALGHLTALTTLRLDHNRLKALPDALCTLQSLRALGAASNHLGELPRKFGRGLAKLRALCLENNALKTLPGSMTALTALRSLRLAGNPLPCLALYPQ